MGISVNACYEDEKGPLVGPFSFAFAVEPVRGVFCTLIPLYVMDGMSKNATHEPGVDALVRSIVLPYRVYASEFCYFEPRTAL